MPSFSPRALALISAIVLSPCVAKAEKLEVTSHVVAATVFTDRALVTRAAKIHVPGGSHVISIADMPAGLKALFAFKVRPWVP